MVYMEPQGLGYEPFIKSWLMYRLPPGFEQKEKDDKVVTESARAGGNYSRYQILKPQFWTFGRANLAVPVSLWMF